MPLKSQRHMKRELAFALEAQSQFIESFGRTRSSKSLPTNRTNEKIQVSNENEAQSNASIDQNRARVHTCNALHVYRRNNNKRLKTEEGESVINEESKGGFVIKEVKNDYPVEVVAPTRRFTRSALKSKVEGLGMGNGNSGNNVESEGVKDGVGLEAVGNVSVLGDPAKRKELKKLLKNRPTTVEELLETGLLEGYPVFYKRGKKENVLWGTIKDAGILCYCSLCKGSRVVTPSVFEVHARNIYRREYISLENGRSLLQVVKACMSTSVETLEETIQSFIGPLPAKELNICLNCKGKLCDSCVDSGKSQASPTNTTCVKSSKMSTNTTFEKTRSSKLVLVMKSSASAKLRMSFMKKGRGKMKWKSSRLGLFPKSPRHASVPISQNRSEGKISKKLSKSSLVPRSCKSESKSRWKITKKDLRMHKLVFQENGLPEGTEVAYYSGGQVEEIQMMHLRKLLEGYKKDSGIFCRCCNSVLSASQFEAHAGWSSRRKPYGYIYTSNGVSLHELAISLLKGREYSRIDNDDLCIICADGGNLLLCDGCPRAFHKECASLCTIPRGKWYCTYCQNMFQREKFVEHNANALAAGRVSGVVDPIEQITTRCIRIVKNPDESQVIACVLCRGYDYSKFGFGPRTVILCDQCEKEYHVGCLKEHKMADLKELPKEKWFCCTDCRRIYSALQNLIISGAEKLPDTLLHTIKKKEKEKGLGGGVTEYDVKWRLLSGKIASRDTRLLLSQAVAIFHECFDPIVDSVTGRDFIPTMVYGRNIRGQDFGGMYCAILTVNSSVVSAGILRVFGPDRAELPLVATSNGNQGKGYFQLLFSCIEKLLAFLKVRSLVLPAAEVAESIWTDKFCFKRISPQQLIEYRKDFWQMLTFKGTSMLEKPVPSCRIIRKHVAGS